MTENELWTGVVERIRTITGLTTIRSEESGPRPAFPYMMVSYLGSRPLTDHPRFIDYTPERADEGPYDTSGAGPLVTAIPLIDTEWHFSIFAFDADVATGRLRPLRSAFELSQIMEPIYPLLVVNDMSRIRRVPEWVNEGWEERAQCDIFVHGVTQDGFVIDTIDATPFTVNRL